MEGFWHWKLFLTSGYDIGFQKINEREKKLEIIRTIISDHNPVMWIGKFFNVTYSWRINESLLLKEETVNKLKVETDKFF